MIVLHERALVPRGKLKIGKYTMQEEISLVKSTCRDILEVARVNVPLFQGLVVAALK